MWLSVKYLAYKDFLDPSNMRSAHSVFTVS